MKFAPVVGAKAAMDRFGMPEGFGSGERAMVPQVSQTGIESGVVRQSPAAEIGTLLGSTTVEQKEAGQRKFTLSKIEQQSIQKLNKDIQHITDARRSGKEPPQMLVNRVVKNFMKMGTTPDAVVQKILNEEIRRGMTTEQAITFGTDLQISLKEAIRASNYQRGQAE
jgi:hypothetical protein